MSTPIPEEIISRVATRLALITTGNGYNQTVTVLRPLRLNDDLPGDYRLVLGIGDHQPAPEHDRPGNPPAVAYNLTILIEGEVRLSDSSTTTIDAAAMTLQADVVKALTNAANWYQWGGFSIDSKLTGTGINRSGDGGSAGFTFSLVVLYRCSETDPYTVRA